MRRRGLTDSPAFEIFMRGQSIKGSGSPAAVPAQSAETVFACGGGPDTVNRVSPGGPHTLKNSLILRLFGAGTAGAAPIRRIHPCHEFGGAGRPNKRHQEAVCF